MARKRGSIVRCKLLQFFNGSTLEAVRHDGVFLARVQDSEFNRKLRILPVRHKSQEPCRGEVVRVWEHRGPAPIRWMVMEKDHRFTGLHNGLQFVRIVQSSIPSRV